MKTYQPTATAKPSNDNDMLIALGVQGTEGLDRSPGDPIASWAYDRICALEHELSSAQAALTEAKAEVARLIHDKGATNGRIQSQHFELTNLRARVAELVAAMYEAIREARTLECNTDPLVDRILKPAIDAAKGQP